jgi:putative FmdB family regulatory protein
MPLYDYRCADCNLTFEVSRSFKDSDVPALCPMCDREAKREISMPMATFTRGAAAESLRQSPAASSEASRRSHHGHSHGPGAGSHSH